MEQDEKLSDLEKLSALAHDLAVSTPDWQWTTLQGDNGPYQSLDEMIDGIAKTVRYSDDLTLHAITWDNADEDGRSSVVCHTGNGPTSAKHAQYIAAVKPSNIITILNIVANQQDEVNRARTRITELEALLAEAREVVKPFAEVGNAWMPHASDGWQVFGGDQTKNPVTIGDLRRAAALSTKLEAQG